MSCPVSSSRSGGCTCRARPLSLLASYPIAGDSRDRPAWFLLRSVSGFALHVSSPSLARLVPSSGSLCLVRFDPFSVFQRADLGRNWLLPYSGYFAPVNAAVSSVAKAVPARAGVPQGHQRQAGRVQAQEHRHCRRAGWVDVCQLLFQSCLDSRGQGGGLWTGEEPNGPALYQPLTLG